MKRDSLLFILSFLGLLGASVITLSLISARDYELRGYNDAARDPNLPFLVPRFGVNAELTQYSAQELDQQFKLMESVNVNWVRQLVRWDQIEPEQGQFQWEAWDNIFDVLEKHPRLHMVPVFVNAPQWARRNGTSDSAPPTDPTSIVPFLNLFASRYGNYIDYYQIWDEPNLQSGWGGAAPHPAEYVALLAEAYKVIHQIDLQSFVLAAALAPTVETGPQNLSDWLYLHNMYSLGAKDYMDGVAAKPYGYDFSPLDRDVAPEKLNFSRIILLREEMIRNGDEKKSIWISNWGWNSLPSSWSGEKSIWGSVSSEQQIQYVKEAIDRVEREWPWIGGMILQQWQPDLPLDNPQWGFTLLNPDNTATVLFQSLGNLQSNQFAQNGFYPAVNPFVDYSGVWSFSQLGADIGWVQDSQLDFKFIGANVSMLLRKNNYTAYLYPTIDGQPANAVPRDSSGNSYVVLTSPEPLTPEISLVPIGRNLSSQFHTLHVIADRGWDQWAIAGFGVSSGDFCAPYDQWLGVALLSLTATLLSTLTMIRKFKWTLFASLVEKFEYRASSTIRFATGIVVSLVLLVAMMLTWGNAIPAIIRREPVPLLLGFLTAGLIKLEPGIILTIIALISLFVIIYNHLHIGLALTIFWIPFFLFPVELYKFAFPICEIILLLTVAAGTIQFIAAFGKIESIAGNRLPLKKRRFPVVAMDYLVLLLGVLGIISLLWSQQQRPAVTELRTIILEPILFYIILRSQKLTTRQLNIILMAFLFGGFLVSVIGLWQYFQGTSVITAEAGAKRLASVYGSPNNVALYIGRCTPFVIAFAFTRQPLFHRIVSTATLIIMGSAVLLTQSVGAIFIGIPLSTIVVCVLVLGKYIGRILFLSASALLLVILVSIQIPRFARAFDFSSGTNFYRLRVWESAINVIQDHPLTGLGLDQFLYAFRSEYILPDAWQEPNLSHPHNIFLDFWIRLGFCGVILLAAIEVLFWKYALRLYKKFRYQQSSTMYPIIVGAIGSMTYVISHGLVDNSVFVQDLSYVFLFLLAVIVIIQTDDNTLLSSTAMS